MRARGLWPDVVTSPNPGWEAQVRPASGGLLPPAPAPGNLDELVTLGKISDGARA